MVAALLEGGIDVNYKGSDNVSALKLAINIGNKEAVELLVKYHAKLDDI